MTLPVVLLHGFSGSPASFDALVPRLGPDVRVIRPALLGHGAAGDDAVTTFDGELDRLAALLRAEPGPLHVAGYSFGGRVALGLLVRHPALFASATLVSLSPGLEDDAERPPRRAADERLAGILERDGIEAFVDVWQALPLFASQRRLPEAVQAAQRAARLRHDPRGLARSFRVTGLAEMPSYWGSLPSLDLPVALIGGALDEKYCQTLQAMKGRLPRATLDLIPDVGHNVVLEAPDRVAAAIRRAIEVAG